MKDSKSSCRYGDYYERTSLEEVWTLYKEVWNPEKEEEEEEKEVVMKFAMKDEKSIICISFWIFSKGRNTF